eukprot:9028769-Alexandrium_andersonii.AAC.1
MWADRRNVRSRAPAAPEPHAVLPPGAEAPARVARASPEEHLLAELVAVVATRFAEEPLKRRPAV